MVEDGDLAGTPNCMLAKSRKDRELVINFYCRLGVKLGINLGVRREKTWEPWMRPGSRNRAERTMLLRVYMYFVHTVPCISRKCAPQASSQVQCRSQVRDTSLGAKQDIGAAGWEQHRRYRTESTLYR